MNKRELLNINRSMVRHAEQMSVYGLKGAIEDDWVNPQWGNELFDLMNRVLERKMGKRAYAEWFNALPLEQSK